MRNGRRIATAVAVGVTGLVTFTGPAADAALISTRTVALSGGAVPNSTQTNETFTSFGSVSINSSGFVAFSAIDAFTGAVTTGNSQNIYTLFSEGSGSLTPVVREGSATPNTAGQTATAPAGTFLNFNGSTAIAPTLDNGGHVTFYSQLKLNGSGGTVDTTINNSFGFYSNRSGPLALDSRKGDALGGTTLTALAATTLNDPVVNPSGRFASVVTTADSTNGIVSDASGTPVFVARGGATAPAGTGGATFLSTGFTTAPSINAAGQTAFRASLTGSSVTAATQGLFSETGTNNALRAVAVAGFQVPGLATGDNYGAVFPNNPGFNNAGQTAFVDTLVNGGGSSDILTANNTTTGQNANNGGVFVEANGTVRLAAQKGSQAAGTPAGAVYNSFNPVVINDAGRVAFSCSLANSSTGTGGVVTGTGGNSSAIFSEGFTGSLALVERTGAPAPGAPGDTIASIGTNYALNARGELLFSLTLTTGVGDVTGNTNNNEVVATDTEGQVDLLARNGQPFQVAPGDVRTIASLGVISLSGGEDGRISTWSDSGVVPLSITFTDGSSGIFTIGVPEPTSLGLVAVAAAASLGRRRRR